MSLYALLPCRLTAWLGLWALMDDAWAQLDDPVVLQMLAMFRQAAPQPPAAAAPRCSPAHLVHSTSAVLLSCCCCQPSVRRYVPADMSGAGIPPRFSAEQVRRVPATAPVLQALVQSSVEPISVCLNSVFLPLLAWPAQLAGPKAPMLVIAAEQDIFGGGAAMAARASRVLPNCTAEVMAGARHCMSPARMEQACQRVIAFLKEHCGA